MAGPDKSAQKGKVIGMLIAGVGVFWIVATFLGSYFELSMRIRALFDLFALAGFVLAIVMIYQLWRARQTDRG